MRGAPVAREAEQKRTLGDYLSKGQGTSLLIRANVAPAPAAAGGRPQRSSSSVQREFDAAFAGGGGGDQGFDAAFGTGGGGTGSDAVALPAVPSAAVVRYAYHVPLCNG